MSEGVSPERAKVIAAAEAAASWARARRAAWTSAPLPETGARPGTPAAAAARAPASTAPAAAAPPVAHEPVAPSPVPVRSLFGAEPVAAPHAPERTHVAVLDHEPPRARGAPVARLVLPVAALVLVSAFVAGAIYWKWTAPPATRVETPASSPVTQPASRFGTLRVSSNPTGANVLVDGKPRGVTPLVLSDVSPGAHTVEIRGASGTVRRSVTLAAGATAEVSESIFSGWVALYSPFELSVAEGNRPLRLDDSSQIMLPAGPHELRLTNRTLEFESVRRIDVRPGETTAVSVSAPQSSLTVTTTEPAEVWVDGARVGATPLESFAIEIGGHEIGLRRPGAAERRVPVTITTKPFSLHVDFSKP